MAESAGEFRTQPVGEPVWTDSAGRGEERQPDLVFRALEGAGLPVAVADRSGRIRYVNRAFAAELGWEPDEARGRYLGELVHGPGENVEAEELCRSVRAADGYAGRVRVHRRDGASSVHEVTTAPFEDPRRGGGSVVMLRDPTGEIGRSPALQQRQRLELLGNLAGGIAHDFNNLLTAISGFAELLERTLEPSSVPHRYATEIESTARRATDLTGQLLAFSSRQVIRPALLALNEAVSGFESTARRLLSEEIVLETDLSPDVGEVRVDPTQLEQIVLNLVVNARDAMPEGGRLVLCTRNASAAEERRARWSGEPEGDFAVLSVEDTGTGIDPEALPRIFEPFFTTKTRGRGTGLGLATVYGIVRQSGGFVRASSEPGVGTLFEVFLPRADSPEEAPCAVPAAPAGTELTVLLVEDEDGVRELCREVLEMEGYEVVAASDGRTALALATERKGPIHLLLTDVMMPRMHGPALAAEFSRVRPGVPVIFMSGYVDAKVRLEESWAEGLRFLPKPLDVDELAQTVRSAVEGAKA